MSRKRIVCALLGASALVPGGLVAQYGIAGAATGGKELVAIIEFATEGASKAEVAALTDRLQDLLLRSGKFTLVDRNQMDTILKEQALQQTGCTSQECAVKVGKVLGVKKIVVGRIIKLSDTTWQVAAQLLDVETAETVQAVSLPHRGDFFSLLDQGTVNLTARLTSTPLPTGSSVAQSQPAQAPNEPDKVFLEPATGMEFVWVPGGTFEMGCGSWNQGCDGDETPARQVTVGGFWLGKTEVTQGQWQKVMGNNPSNFKKAADYPVEGVNWNDAQEFIRRLNAQSGVIFRLPTEAEWEYACRAGGKEQIYGTKTGRLESGTANYRPGLFGTGQGATTRVASYPPNGLGLYEMSGNVQEWVQDTYDHEAYAKLANLNPVNTSGDNRVYRGGGWNTIARSVRCSNRLSYAPSLKQDNLGFRVARTE
jgi:formylglycine-generating enzyme required for sulfatase activity